MNPLLQDNYLQIKNNLALPKNPRPDYSENSLYNEYAPYTQKNMNQFADIQSFKPRLNDVLDDDGNYYGPLNNFKDHSFYEPKSKSVPNINDIIIERYYPFLSKEKDVDPSDDLGHYVSDEPASFIDNLDESIKEVLKDEGYATDPFVSTNTLKEA